MDKTVTVFGYICINCNWGTNSAITIFTCHNCGMNSLIIGMSVDIPEYIYNKMYKGRDLLLQALIKLEG